MAICELHRRLRDMEQQAKEATSPVTAVVVNVEKPGTGTRDSPAPSTPERSRSPTMPLMPSEPSRQSPPEGNALMVRSALTAIDARVVDERGVTEAEASLGGVEEVLYGMEALGRKAFGVTRAVK